MRPNRYPIFALQITGDEPPNDRTLDFGLESVRRIRNQPKRQIGVGSALLLRHQCRTLQGPSQDAGDHRAIQEHMGEQRRHRERGEKRRQTSGTSTMSAICRLAA